ncbi:type II toxin-antitoxin system RelE/ParE family toxin [Marinobacter sp. SS8-8]
MLSAYIAVYQIIDSCNIFIVRVRHEREDWLRI